MATVVVCEDDAVTRGTLSAICEQVGLQVVAEVDSGPDAVELTRRFGVDVLVLDLALGRGISGKETLEALQDLDPYPYVVVFTSYAGDADELVRLGAREVVEKPHFDRLITVLEQVSGQVSGQVPGQVPGQVSGQVPPDRPSLPGEERRRRVRPATPPPELPRSPSGISSEADLAQSLDATAEGDAIIVVRVMGLDRLAADAPPMLADDVRMAVARLLRATLRAQDVVHESDAADGLVAVLRGGDTQAPSAVWARLTQDIAAAGLPGQPVGACAPIDAMGARNALARASAALQTASADTRLLISA